MNKDRVSIAFTGDIGFDKYMTGKWADDALLSGDVLNFFRDSDHVCANVEGALIDLCEDSSRSAYFHSMDTRAAGFLRKIGADIWSLGNNHAMDAGREGIVSTQRIASECGAVTLGAGLNIDEASSPVYISEAGGIGIITLSYMMQCVPATEGEAGTFRWDDFELISRRIGEIKSKCRWCVVVVHGGEEFSAMPNPYTRDKYIRYLELGADAVVAHHPHVPENYESFDGGKFIFYSLGNFIFDTDYQRAHPYTDVGVLLRLVFTEESMDFEAIGIRINRAVGRIEEGELPAIFTDIRADEYELLSPLSAHAFIEDDKRKMIYLEPNRFKNATDEEWNKYFYGAEADGYFKGEHMDLSIVFPYSERAEDGAWRRSRHKSVVAYLLDQIDFEK